MESYFSNSAVVYISAIAAIADCSFKIHTLTIPYISKLAFKRDLTLTSRKTRPVLTK